MKVFLEHVAVMIVVHDLYQHCKRLFLRHFLQRIVTVHDRVLSGGGGEIRVCFPPKIIILWQNNDGIALFLITLQVLESLVVLHDAGVKS